MFNANVILSHSSTTTLFIYCFAWNALLTTLTLWEERLDFVIYLPTKVGSRPEFFFFFLNAAKGVTGALASVLPRRWAAVFVNTSVAVGRDWGGGWVDCNGTCSNSNYPWTHAAVEDLLGPRVAFIITRHKQVWSASPSWHQSSSTHQIWTPCIHISPALAKFYITYTS